VQRSYDCSVRCVCASDVCVRELLFVFSHVVIHKNCFDCSFASAAICLQSVGIHVSGLYLFNLD